MDRPHPGALTPAARVRVRELRCPVNPRKKFAELWLFPGDPRPSAPAVIRIACTDCRKGRRAQGQPAQVIHVWAADGTYEATDVEPQT